MDKFKKRLKTRQDVKVFIDILISNVLNKVSISDNPMVDGFIIGLIHSNSKAVATLILTNNQLPPMSDNAIQQIEQCIIWLCNNEDTLIKKLGDYNSNN